MFDCQTSHQNLNHVLFDCPHSDLTFEIGCLLADVNQDAFRVHLQFTMMEDNSLKKLDCRH